MAAALASFALGAFFANNEAELAGVLSNVNGNHQNIGFFLQEVAKKLGLTDRQLFEKFNKATGDQRDVLLGQLKFLAVASDLGSDKAKLLFGPLPTIDSPDIKKLKDLFGEDSAKEILEVMIAQRDQAARDFGDLLQKAKVVD